MPDNKDIPKENAPQPAARKQTALVTVLLGLLLLAGSSAMYYALLTPIVNADGPHYVKAIESYPTEYLFPPGHVLYDTVCKGFWQLWRMFGYTGDAMQPMRILGVGGAALGVFFFFLAAARLFSSRTLQVFLSVAFATSFGYWSEATYFIKPYSLSLGLLMLALWFCLVAGRRPSFWWPALAGMAAAAATMIHITNIMWCVFVAALMLFYGKWPAKTGQPKRRWGILIRNTAVAAGLQVILVAVVYYAIYGTYIARHDQSAGLIAWVQSADHGFDSGFNYANMPKSLFGFARSVYYVEDVWTCPIWRWSLEMAALYILLIVIIVAAARLRKFRPMEGRGFPLAAGVGALPYIYLGLKFFSDDPERWLWLVPLLILAVGCVLAAWKAKAGGFRPLTTLIPVLVLLALASFSFVQKILPLRLDYSGYNRAVFIAGHLKDGDLLFRPGHGWDEYIGLFNKSAYKDLFAAYLAYEGSSNPMDIFKDPGTPGADSWCLDRIIKKTLASGHDVYVVRVFDPYDAIDGWYVSREKGFTGASRDELIKYAQERFSDAEMGKMFISYFSFAGRTEVLEKQMGAEKTREIAMNYLPLFYNEYKDSEESFSYYLNHEEFLQAKDYFDHLAPQYNSLTAKPPDVYLLWRSLTMIPLDARLYKLYLSQYRWKTAGIFKDKNGTATLWRLEKTGEEMKKP